MQNDFLKQLEDLLECPIGSLTGSEILAELPEWDSVAVLGVIALSETMGGRALSPVDFQNVRTVNEVLALVASGKEKL